MNLERADVEQPAIHPKGALRIELQDHLRQSVVDETLFGAAADIAKQFARFLHGEGHAVSAEEGAQAPHVAQHIAAARYALEKPQRPRRGRSRLPRLIAFGLNRDRDRGRGRKNLTRAQAGDKAGPGNTAPALAKPTAQRASRFATVGRARVWASPESSGWALFRSTFKLPPQGDRHRLTRRDPFATAGSWRCQSC